MKDFLTNYFISNQVLFNYKFFTIHRSKVLDDYNDIVNTELIDYKKSQGIYLWINNQTDDILYVGMSGRLKNDGNKQVIINDYSVRKRLVSSRKRIYIESLPKKKDVSTREFLNKKFSEYPLIQEIRIEVYLFDPIKHKLSPTFIESMVLQEIYTNTNSIPLFNNSF
jgi:hypothetical protein